MLSAPQKRYRPTVAIDETKVKEGGGDVVLFFLWAAVDTESRAESCLASRSLTPTRDGHDASLPFHTTGVTDVHERTHRRCS